MISSEKILAKLAEWRPAAGTRTSLTVPDEASGWAVSLTADRNDELGCLVWELNCIRLAESPAVDDLQTWAHRLANRITGLLETLKVVEVDRERNEAILRSTRVTQRGAALLYFEVLLQGTGNLTIRRYQASHDAGQRRQIPFALTHEALATVVENVSAA